ncbi:MAG: T9SS type A sorting domain-containing protein [Bacteroidetes bacterium]|nr:T9SS type A sorting domain-containing protein [Bacteroidota bacterium]
MQHQNVSKANSASLELNISTLSQGLYICNFYNNEAKISLKIVKGN